MSCGACNKIHCSPKKKKASASWDKVLNVLFRMSEEISDRGEIESTYPKFHSRAFTSRQPFSHFAAASFHFLDTSILTVMCSLECRAGLELTCSLELPMVEQWGECPFLSISGPFLTRDQGMEAAAAALLKCSPWQQRFSTAKRFALLIWYSITLTNQVSSL